MKILFVASEMAPYVKTGGLGDVIGALPRALRALGHDVRVVIPYYNLIDPARFPAELLLDRIEVWLPAGSQTVSVWRLKDPAAAATVYLIKCDPLFHRANPYSAEGGREYPDNPLRFSYFCMAVFWMLRGLEWIPDVFHLHDWQAGMIAAYLRKWEAFRDNPEFSKCKTLLTIHNLAYQGVCPPEFVNLLGLPREAFNLTEMEFFGKLNLLKGGIVYSDRLSTVSRRYAGEIQTAGFGCGLEGVLRARSTHLSGIMNGIDTDVWNPATDTHLPAQYDEHNLEGKALCKAELQRRYGLPERPDVPVASIVSRLVEQKGFDLIAEAIPSILELGVQFVLLGTGEEKYRKFFTQIAAEHPDRAGVMIGFDEGFSHLLQAGSDMLFMPSRFEPCGLNQLYGMRYGTVPIARQTGGLADSVDDATEAKILSGEATGFTFARYSAGDFLLSVKRAVQIYRDRERPDLWRKLMLNGMERDTSWEHSAQAYQRLMFEMLKR